MKVIDLNTMNLSEMKVLAYDTIVLIKRQEMMLNEINIYINKKEAQNGLGKTTVGQGKTATETERPTQESTETEQDTKR